jgi:hypothetical protein
MYFHIVTPIHGASDVMYKYTIDGYCYAAGQSLDLVFVGYAYHHTNSSAPHLASSESHGAFSPPKMTQYYHSSVTHNVVLMFGPLNRYCLGFSVSYQGHYRHAESGIGAYTVQATATDARL